MKSTRAQIHTLILGLLLGCGGGLRESPTHTPQLGRYQFDATVQGAAYGGVLTITAADPASATWSLTMQDFGHQTDAGTTGWDEDNGYIFAAHSNGWNFLPHLKRSGATYACSGNAVQLVNGVLSSAPMACTWTYLGP